MNKGKEELDKWYDEKYCLEAVKKNYNDIKYAKVQNEEIVMEVLNRDNSCIPDCFKYATFQNKKVCLEAVKKHFKNLKYVKEQNEEIVMKALGQYGYGFKYATFQNEKICIEAVGKTYHNLKYVKEQTEKIIMEAFKRDKKCFSFMYATFQNENICMKAIEGDPFNLQYVKEQTEKIIMEALKLDENVLSCINNPEIYYKIIENKKYLKIDTDRFDYYKITFQNDDYKIITDKDLLFKTFTGVIKIEESFGELSGCPLFVGDSVISEKGHEVTYDDYHYDDSYGVIFNGCRSGYADEPKIDINKKIKCNNCLYEINNTRNYKQRYYLNKLGKICVKIYYTCHNCFKDSKEMIENVK